MDNLKFDKKIDKQVCDHVVAIENIVKEFRERTNGDCDPDQLLIWYKFDEDTEQETEFCRDVTVSTIAHFRQQMQQIEHHLCQIEATLSIK